MPNSSLEDKNEMYTLPKLLQFFLSNAWPWLSDVVPKLDHSHWRRTNTSFRKMGEENWLLFHQKLLNVDTRMACFLLQTQQKFVSHFQTRDWNCFRSSLIWSDAHKSVVRDWCHLKTLHFRGGTTYSNPFTRESIPPRLTSRCNKANGFCIL